MLEAAMKTLLALTVCLTVLPGAAAAQAPSLDVGISVSEGRLRDFYLAVGNHYGVPAPSVVDVRERSRCLDEELPVVFFLAARARVAPTAIVELRARRMSWLDISFHYGLTPDIFFVPLRVEPSGPPYGKAYGYYRKYGPRREWQRIVLSDPDVVALVNLRFLSERHGVPPDDVIAMRSREGSFVAINENMGKGKAQKTEQKGKGNSKKK
jgi:hypothetical protein